MKTIVLVCDDVNDHGNGTSNSARQFAEELQRRGFEVRLVGIGAPEFSVREQRIPLVSFLAHKQRMRLAHADKAVLARALDGADLVHVYLPFSLERLAVRMARSRHIPVTAGFHLMPQNVLYSAGLVGKIPWLRRLTSNWLYTLFWKQMYRWVSDIHVPSRMGKTQLVEHGYTNRIHVFSNGVNPRFTEVLAPDSAKEKVGAEVQTEAVQQQAEPLQHLAKPHQHRSEPLHQSARAGQMMKIITSGRLAGEKDYDTFMGALALCKHRAHISVQMCGTGPKYHHLRALARREKLENFTISYLSSRALQRALNGADLFVHPALVELESLSVLEALACGVVPVISDSQLSAASQFALHQRSLFAAGNAKQLAQQIDWWYEHPSVRAEYSARYAQLAREKYSLHASVDAFLAMAKQATRM